LAICATVNGKTKVIAPDWFYVPILPLLWFYERILQVPLYVILEPEGGRLEMRQLVTGLYQVGSDMEVVVRLKPLLALHCSHE